MVAQGGNELTFGGTMTDESGRRLVNIVQACAMTGKCRRTIYFWMERGWLEYRRVPSGHRLIFADSLLRVPE